MGVVAGSRLFLTLCLFASASHAMEYDKVSLPDNQGGLTLSGMATRKFLLMPIYVIGMSTDTLLSPQSSIEKRRQQVMSPKVQKRFDIVLKRDLPAPMMLKGIRDGFQKNCSDPQAQPQASHPCESLKGAFDQLERAILAIKNFSKGDRFTLLVNENGVDVFLRRKEKDLPQQKQMLSSPPSKTDELLAKIPSPNFAAFLPALWLVNPPDGQREITENLLGGMRKNSETQKQEVLH